MEFPGLLSVLLYQDCYAQAIAEEPRLRALALANGTNSALQLYLNYIAKTKQSPSPEHLKSLAISTPKCGEELIEDDLQSAADFKNAYPSGSFRLALEEAWEQADKKYVSNGYAIAHSIAIGAIPYELKAYQYNKRMTERYGDDESKWDKPAFSQIWLNEYLTKNPFVKREVEEVEVIDEHEFSLAQNLRVNEDDMTVDVSLTAVRAVDIMPEQIRWLWQDRIPYGKVTLYSGKPECGKTLALIDLCARVSAGREWPDGQKNLHGPKKVWLACSEDGLADTIRPRLDAAGANLENITFITTVIEKSRDGSGKVRRQLKLDTDLPLLKKALAADPEIALVALDPATSFFGDVNINVDKDIRPIMDTLAAVCNAAGVSFVTVIHHNKRSDVDALQKILGASSVAGAVRAIWGFSEDPDNKDEYFMSRVKGNLSKRKSGMKYKIGENTVCNITAPFIEWGEEHDNSANDLLNQERSNNKLGNDNKQITLAREFLPVALSKGPRFARELYAEAEKMGVSAATLKRAKNELGGITVTQHKDGWMWSNGSDDPIMPSDTVI